LLTDKLVANRWLLKCSVWFRRKFFWSKSSLKRQFAESRKARKVSFSYRRSEWGRCFIFAKLMRVTNVIVNKWLSGH